MKNALTCGEAVACNLACSHCYIPREIPGHRDLTTEQWFGILEQLAKAGCLWLGITGGEALLRRGRAEGPTPSSPAGRAGAPST